MSVNASFTENREYGKQAEVSVSGWLKKRGCAIIPSYDYSGDGDNKAPRISTSNTDYVVPDLDVSSKGNRYWVEVKRNNHAAFNRALGIYVHGIKKRHYEHYLKVQEITGCIVWLFVEEDSTGKLLIAKLNDLTPHPCQCGPCRSGQPWFNCRNKIQACVYFDVSQFKRYDTSMEAT